MDTCPPLVLTVAPVRAGSASPRGQPQFTCIMTTWITPKCNTCFSADPEMHRLALSPKDAARVVATYFDGLSYKDAADHMRREGIISPSTIANYVSLVVDACVEYVMTLFPDISDT